MKLLIEESLDIFMVSIFKTVQLIFYFSSLAFGRTLLTHCFSYLLQNEINYLLDYLSKFKHNNTKIGTDCSVIFIKLYNVCFLWRLRLAKNTTPRSTTITNKFRSFYTIYVSQWIQDFSRAEFNEVAVG